jgi:hypothetical protein
MANLILQKTERALTSDEFRHLAEVPPELDMVCQYQFRENPEGLPKRYSRFRAICRHSAPGP